MHKNCIVGLIVNKSGEKPRHRHQLKFYCQDEKEIKASRLKY